MNSILFCKNKYAFGILEPIQKELKNLNYDFIWFVIPDELRIKRN